MSAEQSQPSVPNLHIALPDKLTSGIVVLRTVVDGASAIATNVPPLRHASQSGFDFGNDGAGAADLSLACTHAILSRMDYVGPVQPLRDGSRVYRLALELYEPFCAEFIEPACDDELRIPWSRTLGWMRRTLLRQLRARGLTQQTLLSDLQEITIALPNPLPKTETDQDALNHQLRRELAKLTGDASILSQFLGMIG